MCYVLSTHTKWWLGTYTDSIHDTHTCTCTHTSAVLPASWSVCAGVHNAPYCVPGLVPRISPCSFPCLHWQSRGNETLTHCVQGFIRQSFWCATHCIVALISLSSCVYVQLTTHDKTAYSKVYFTHFQFQCHVGSISTLMKRSTWRYTNTCA